jgi:hypothetical protein
VFELVRRRLVDYNTRPNQGASHADVVAITSSCPPTSRGTTGRSTARRSETSTAS